MNFQISVQDKSELQKLEESLWREQTRFDPVYMEELMAPDFFEIGRSGRIHSREDCLSQKRVIINAIVPLRNLRIRLLTEDVAQVIYDSKVESEGAIENGRRSSIWTKINRSWKLRFHQGTVF